MSGAKKPIGDGCAERKIYRKKYTAVNRTRSEEV
jgi:hypothetical protein